MPPNSTGKVLRRTSGMRVTCRQAPGAGIRAGMARRAIVRGVPEATTFHLGLSSTREDGQVIAATARERGVRSISITSA